MLQLSELEVVAFKRLGVLVDFAELILQLFERGLRENVGIRSGGSCRKFAEKSVKFCLNKA